MVARSVAVGVRGEECIVAQSAAPQGLLSSATRWSRKPDGELRTGWSRARETPALPALPALQAPATAGHQRHPRRRTPEMGLPMRKPVDEWKTPGRGV